MNFVPIFVSDTFTQFFLGNDTMMSLSPEITEIFLQICRTNITNTYVISKMFHIYVRKCFPKIGDKFYYPKDFVERVLNVKHNTIQGILIPRKDTGKNISIFDALNDKYHLAKTEHGYIFDTKHLMRVLQFFRIKSDKYNIPEAFLENLLEDRVKYLVILSSMYLEMIFSMNRGKNTCEVFSSKEINLFKEKLAIKNIRYLSSITLLRVSKSLFPAEIFKNKCLIQIQTILMNPKYIFSQKPKTFFLA